MSNTEIHRKDQGIEAVLDDIIDLEEYARRGEQPPLARGYRLKVNGEPFDVDGAA